MGATGVSPRPELRVYPTLGLGFLIFSASPPLEADWLRPTLPTLRPPWRSIVKPRGRAPFWTRRRTSTTMSCLTSCRPLVGHPPSSTKSTGVTLGPPWRGPWSNSALPPSTAAGWSPSSAVPPLHLFGYFKAVRARHSVVRYTNRSPRLGMAGRRSGDTIILVGCHVHGQVNENQAHTAKSQACVAL